MELLVILFCILYIVVMIYFVIGATLLFYFREHDWIAKRHPPLLFIATFSCLISCSVVLASTLHSFSGENFFRYPCHVELVIIYFFPSLWLFSYLLRCIHLVYLYSIQQYILANSISPHPDPRDVNSRSIFHPLRQYVVNTSILELERLIRFVSSLFFFIRKDTEQDPNLGRVKHRTLLAALFLMALFNTFLILLHYYVLSKDPADDIGCGSENYIPVISMGGIFIVIMPFFLYLIKPMEDEYWIKKELAWSFAIVCPCFTLYILAVLGIRIQDGTDGLWLAILCVFSYLISIYIPIAKIILRRRRHFVGDYVMEADKFLDKVLGDAKVFSELRELAAKEFNLENLLFIKEFKRQQDLEGNPNQSKKSVFQEGNMLIREMEAERRRYLYEKFIMRNSEMELNLPYQVVEDVMRKVTASGAIQLMDLLPAYRYTRTMFLMNTFSNFAQIVDHRGRTK